MDEAEEVAGGLLVARRHPAVLLDLAPKALREVPVPVALLVVGALLLAGGKRRDHRLRAPGPDRPDQPLAVVALVPDHHLEGHALDQLPPLADVGLLPGRQQELHRQPQPAHAGVDLGPEPAPAPAEGLVALPPRPARFFFAPAAWGWARMMVESRMSHSRSGSCRASKTLCQVPFRAQRSKRRHTEFQLPKRSGRSRQGAPVLAIHRTASRNRRLSRAAQPGWPGRPGSRSLIRSQSASEIAWRWSMAGPPWLGGRPAFYQSYLALVHTA